MCNHTRIFKELILYLPLDLKFLLFTIQPQVAAMLESKFTTKSFFKQLNSFEF